MRSCIQSRFCWWCTHTEREREKHHHQSFLNVRSFGTDAPLLVSSSSLQPPPLPPPAIRLNKRANPLLVIARCCTLLCLYYERCSIEMTSSWHVTSRTGNDRRVIFTTTDAATVAATKEVAAGAYRLNGAATTSGSWVDWRPSSSSSSSPPFLYCLCAVNVSDFICSIIHLTGVRCGGGGSRGGAVAKLC